MLFFQCNESSQQKVFWKFFIFFFAEILEKHQQIIFFFHIATSWRTTLLLQRLLQSQVVTKPGNYAELLLQKTPFFPTQPHQLLLQIILLIIALFSVIVDKST